MSESGMCPCQSEETSWSGLEGGSESSHKDVNIRSVLSTGSTQSSKRQVPGPEKTPVFTSLHVLI